MWSKNPPCTPSSDAPEHGRLGTTRHQERDTRLSGGFRRQTDAAYRGLECVDTFGVVTQQTWRSRATAAGQCGLRLCLPTMPPVCRLRPKTRQRRPGAEGATEKASPSAETIPAK